MDSRTQKIRSQQNRLLGSHTCSALPQIKMVLCLQMKKNIFILEMDLKMDLFTRGKSQYATNSILLHKEENN